MKRVVFILFSLYLSNNYVFAMEPSIEESFESYLQSSIRTPRETFFHIQKDPFQSGPYTFHYHHGILNLARFEPIGSITVQKVARDINPPCLTAECSVNFGFEVSCPFQMNFSVYSNDDLPHSLAAALSESRIVESTLKLHNDTKAIQTIIDPYSPDQALSFVQKLGYQDDGFDMKMFSAFFCKNYLGFT